MPLCYHGTTKVGRRSRYPTATAQCPIRLCKGRVAQVLQRVSDEAGQRRPPDACRLDRHDARSPSPGGGRWAAGGGQRVGAQPLAAHRDEQRTITGDSESLRASRQVSDVGARLEGPKNFDMGGKVPQAAVCWPAGGEESEEIQPAAGAGPLPSRGLGRVMPPSSGGVAASIPPLLRCTRGCRLEPRALPMHSSLAPRRLC